MPGEYRPVGATLASPAPPRYQRVSHYLATAVTTAQRLMHAIVAASRPELPCFCWFADKPVYVGEHTLIFWPIIAMQTFKQKALFT